MSYWVSLRDEDGTVLEMEEAFQEGGAYAIGGTRDCRLSITYNYSEVYGGLVRGLAERKASETIRELREFVDAWPNAKPYSRDYWAPTPGNAVAAIKRLLSFAEAHPEGRWEVS